MSTLNAEALETLTPEEREAIEGTDYSEAELAAMKGIAGDDDGDDEDDDDEDGAGDATAAAAASAAAVATGDAAGKEATASGGEDGQGGTGDAGVDADVAAAKAAKQAEADRLAEQEAAAKRTASNFNYSAQLPADFNDRLAALDTRAAELKQKFRDGEIEFDDFDAQREELFRERSELNSLRTKAEISEEMRSQSAEHQWGQAVNGFIDWASKLPEDGGRIDYSKDSEKAADLDSFVKTLAANPANESKDMRWFLEQAHKRVLALHDLAPAKAAPAPAPTPTGNDKQEREDKLKQAKQDRKPNTENLPPSIANVPGGDGPGDVGSEFADLDNLSGDQLEAAIRKMSPEQRERFSRGT